MKKGALLLMIFCSSILFAQNKNVEPTYKQEGELVAVTTYYEDGKIMEQGFYKDKKLHGEWNKFDKSGMKITKAFYNDGIKTGKWIFLNKGKITEVVYDQNKIAAITELKSEHLAIN